MMVEDAPWTDFVHTGPGTLAGRFMRSFWQPISRSQDLAAGHSLPLMVMSDELTLYRGGSGLPHLVAFRCAHRGTQLSTGWVEGDEIRCFYHGWKYDATGQCTEQPAEPEPFCSRIRIKSYPVQEYLGLIFAYLGEGEAPSLPRYAEMEDEGVLMATPPVTWPCNYFNRLENSADEVHVAFAHRESAFGDHGLAPVPDVSGFETDYGLEIHADRPGQPTRITHFHMPNINRIKSSPDAPGAPWGDNVSWRVPIDDTHVRSFVVSLTHLTGEAAESFREKRLAALARAAQLAPTNEVAERVLRGELRSQEIEERTNIVNVQDYVALVGQGAIADREHEHLGHSDIVVALFRRIWQRELQNLHEGRPLKPWRRPERLATTEGA